MAFRYRYVDFGTSFSAGAEPRYDTDLDPRQLGANELAVDVGGVCWGWNGEERSILDHHFYRETGQFPSAAAAVLHNAPRIRERFLSLAAAGDVWLVSHRQPDFDAFCAMYLARALLAGLISTDGWEVLGLDPGGWIPGRDRLNWFEPVLDGVPPSQRWPILLAAYAARVDNSRRLSCPKNRALHSVLYAAIARGRDYAATGAWEFFEAVRQALTDPAQPLNPLYDSVLEDDATFVPERALLDREIEAYERDIARARRTIVFVPQAREPFQAWYRSLGQRPLLSGPGLLPEPAHLDPGRPGLLQADGLYLRDPECLLFKEWARLDVDHSPLGQGFLFTAVAYSMGRRGAGANETEYFFALDPERALPLGLHLYPVWARLQAAEVRARHSEDRGSRIEDRKDKPPSAVCREGYEGRAGAWKPYFDDPWYDGVSYSCTIVATPARGTAIGPAGVRSDLSDDPVARLVEEQLEWGAFASDLTLKDCPGSADRLPAPPPVVEAVAARPDEVHPPQPGCYRFGFVGLKDGVDLLQGRAAEQIARVLWRRLDGDSGFEGRDVPQRWLVCSPDWVGVWNRHGVMIACKGRAASHKDRLEALFQDLVEVARGVQALARTEPTRENIDRLLRDGDQLVRRVARTRHQLALPEHRLLGYFFDASRLDQVLSMLRDVNQAAAELAQSAKVTELAEQQVRVAAQVQANVETVTTVQRMVEWIEVILISVYLAHLWHMFAHDLVPGLIKNAHLAHGVVSAGVLLSAAAGAIGTALWLKPWTHRVVHGEKKNALGEGSGKEE
jgi:hypothetical protein